VSVRFIDEATIHAHAGNGGNGCLAFRREKHVPRGGPSGGNGGRGGHVILVADERLDTLMDHAYRRHYKAERGGHGEGDLRTGKQGEDLLVPVPVGTMVFDVETEDLVADLTEDGQEVIVASGGHGGRGNASFVSSTNRTPRRVEPGGQGEERLLRLVLKSMADVGLIGLPNVGKSTFLRVVSRATPKVAAYPFTTMSPHLGIAQLDDERRFALADLPGLVEGASQGRGLGLRFLRHVERTRVLVHMITVDETGNIDAAFAAWQAVRGELESYGNGLAEKPEIPILTKMDLPWVRDAYDELAHRFRGEDRTLLAVSAATRQGVSVALDAIWHLRLSS